MACNQRIFGVKKKMNIPREPLREERLNQSVLVVQEQHGWEDNGGILLMGGRWRRRRRHAQWGTEHKRSLPPAVIIFHIDSPDFPDLQKIFKLNF